MIRANMNALTLIVILYVNWPARLALAYKISAEVKMGRSSHH